MSDEFDEVEVQGGLLLVHREAGTVPAVVVPHDAWWLVVAFEYLHAEHREDGTPVDRPVLDGGTREAAAREFTTWWRDRPDHGDALGKTVDQAKSFVEGWNEGIGRIQAR